MIYLSAFADEISPDLETQIEVLRSENIHFVDFRSAWNTNVLDLTDEQVMQAKELLNGKGIQVAAIGSPIGKVPVDTPFEEYMQRFERALAVAEMFGTRYIRIFSFYPSSDQPDTVAHREKVLHFLHEMTERSSAAQVTLLHENEKGIYGDTIARNAELLQSVDHPNFRAAFDPANYLQCQQVPYPDAYEAVRPWLGYVHVKDVAPDGTLVVAGEGAARWRELLQRLRDDGYSGYLALEPHLAISGKYQGFSGIDLFRRAARALQGLLHEIEWDYE